MLVFDRYMQVALFVGAAMGTRFTPPFTALGIADIDGALRGGCVFHSWNGSNVEIAARADRPFRRAEMQGIRHYVFEQLGARRATFRTLATNVGALRFLRDRADSEGIVRDWFPEGDAMQFAVFRDDPRWARWKAEG